MISYLISCSFEFNVLLLIIIITLLYYYSTSTYDTWQKLNIPYARPMPLFGNVFKMISLSEHQTSTYERIYRQFPDAKICGYYHMRTPYLMIRDPELINTMFIKDFSYFTDHGIDIDPTVNLMARSLFFMTGKKWKTMRQKLSPGFTSGKLKGSYDQIVECSDQLLENIDEKSTKQTDGFEVKEVFGNLATAVIGTCAFGLKLDTIANEKSDFRKYVKEIISPGKRIFLMQALSLLFPKVIKRLKLHSFPLDATNFFHSVINDVISYRTENNLVRNDLTQTLLDARKELVLNSDMNDEDKFIELDIVANAILMFAAGSETIAATASFCFYELALNKDIQDRLRAEISSTKQKYDGQFSNDYLMDLHYADMVLNETHRKYSIVVNLTREATQTYKIPEESIFIEKGQKIVIPMYSIHNDPKYYPNPEVFDPERFTTEEKDKRPNGTFLPFGDGPRHCIGKRFAELELKIILSKLLSKYEVLPCEKTDIPLKMKRLLGLRSPKNGIWLSFKAITD